LSSVWVNLQVYQKDLPLVSEGQEVVISAGPDTPEGRGKISYLSPTVDEETRTATARVVLPNASGYWRPGLFVKGKVKVKSIHVGIIVPRTAIQTIENTPVVFVETKEGFRPSPVSIGKGNEDYVEIISGLDPGQRFVSKGAFTLKAQLMKGTFSGDHEH